MIQYSAIQYNTLEYDTVQYNTASLWKACRLAMNSPACQSESMSPHYEWRVTSLWMAQHIESESLSPACQERERVALLWTAQCVESKSMSPECQEQEHVASLWTAQRVERSWSWSWSMDSTLNLRMLTFFPTILALKMAEIAFCVIVCYFGLFCVI